MSSRDQEIDEIRDLRRQAFLGKLMLGELQSWNDFLKPETEAFEELTRSQIKQLKHRLKSELKGEIKKFFKTNFVDMKKNNALTLYHSILDGLGYEIALPEFETKYAKIRRDRLEGIPEHCTAVFSFWGLQFKFPEDELSKDVLTAMNINIAASKGLKRFKDSSQEDAEAKRSEISELIRQENYTSRSIFLTCFNLVEAYLNGISWAYVRNNPSYQDLSATKQKLLNDGSFEKKLLKYPEIISGKDFLKREDQPIIGFLDKIKPYRDSLVHASPFQKPENYGGYDKLRYLYEIDNQKAQEAFSITVEVLKVCMDHVNNDIKQYTPWFNELLEFERNTSLKNTV